MIAPDLLFSLPPAVLAGGDAWEALPAAANLPREAELDSDDSSDTAPLDSTAPAAWEMTMKPLIRLG